MTAFLLCLALVLTGCSTTADPPPQEEVPTTPVPSAVPEQQDFALPYYLNADLHPIFGNNRANMVLTSLVYQGLFELDNTFTPHGVLCSDYSVSDDRLVWTFSLSDAVFSDGSPVTPADVIHSLNLARTSTLYATRLSKVLRMDTGTDNSVVVTLSQPVRYLPALLDIPIIRDLQDGSMPLGTGPYCFVEDGGPLRLARESFAPDTAPEEIPLLAIEDADDLIYAFDAGKISLTVSDPTGSNTLGYSVGYEAFDFPTTTMLYVGFQAVEGPCSDPLIRQALSRSFDRTTVTGALLAGHADATCLPISPRSTQHNPSYEQAGGYDPDTAKQLLLSAGCREGEDGLLYQGRTPLSLTFAVNTDNPYKLAVAEFLAGQLSEAGLTVTLKKLPWNDYLAALNDGAFDLYLSEVALTADFDLTDLLSSTGTLNFGGYVSEEMDRLLAHLNSTDTGEPVVLSHFQQDAPIAPLCFKTHSVLTQWQAVSGLTPTRQNPFYHLESLRFGAVE